MPLYERRCKKCSRVSEVLRSIEDRSAPLKCDTCGGRTVQAFSPPAVITIGGYNTVVGTTKNRPKYKKRMGGGVAALNPATGGYRPAVTHVATCPNCNTRRNVAVLAKMPYGRRVECEACGYDWIHQESTAPDPMVRGHDTGVRPGKQFGAVRTADDALPERGA